MKLDKGNLSATCTYRRLQAFNWGELSLEGFTQQVWQWILPAPVTDPAGNQLGTEDRQQPEAIKAISQKLSDLGFKQHLIPVAAIRAHFACVSSSATPDSQNKSPTHPTL